MKSDFLTVRGRQSYSTTKSPYEEDIGDILLTEDIIRENQYSLNQIFRSHVYMNGVYTCKICSKRITTKSSFFAHLRLHLKVFVGNCRKCGKGFSRAQHIREHERLCVPGLSRVLLLKFKFYRIYFYIKFLILLEKIS